MTEETPTITDPGSSDSTSESEAPQETPSVTSITPEPTAESDTPAEPGSTELTAMRPEDYEAPDYVTPEMRQFAADNNMTQEQFTNTIGEFGTLLNAQAKLAREQITRLGQQQVTAWGEDADRNLTLARQALKQNDPNGNLAQLLEESGYGSHPAVLQFLRNLGASMEEGGFLKGKVSGPAKAKSMAQRMFPNMKSEA